MSIGLSLFTGIAKSFDLAFRKKIKQNAKDLARAWPIGLRVTTALLAIAMTVAINVVKHHRNI